MVQRSKGREFSSRTTSIVASPQSSVVRYLTRPQFSSFFGFDDEKCKRLAYRVWRFEVESAIQENLHSHEVIAEQIRKSLKGEVKTKIVSFGPGTSVERILEQLHQWETNYCPKLTVFGSKKVKKFLRSQVAWTIQFDKQRTTVPSCSPTKRPWIDT